MPDRYGTVGAVRGVQADFASYKNAVCLNLTAELSWVAGTRVGSPDVAAPTEVRSYCNSDCSFEQVPLCRPILCGPFVVRTERFAALKWTAGVLVDSERCFTPDETDMPVRRSLPRVVRGSEMWMEDWVRAETEGS